MKTTIMTVMLMAAASMLVDSAAGVKENWEQHCAKCHGSDGKGDTKMGKKLSIKDYTDAKVQAEMKDDKAIKSLADGMKEGDKTLMKPFGKTLTEEEIKALVEHIRKFKK